MEEVDGTLIEARDNPEESFRGQQRETPWDDIHVAYFCGEALWTYLNTPFLYTHEGFKTEEISPIQVDGEMWRRLKITFPDNEPHPRTDLLLRPRWFVAPARLHSRYPWRRDWAQLCIGVPRR